MCKHFKHEHLENASSMGVYMPNTFGELTNFMLNHGDCVIELGNKKYPVSSSNKEFLEEIWMKSITMVEPIVLFI